MTTPDKPISGQSADKEELGTDMPLSEKDEVKQAEQKVAEAVPEIKKDAHVGTKANDGHKGS